MYIHGKFLERRSFSPSFPIGASVLPVGMRIVPTWVTSDDLTRNNRTNPHTLAAIPQFHDESASSEEFPPGGVVQSDALRLSTESE